MNTIRNLTSMIATLIFSSQIIAATPINEQHPMALEGSVKIDNVKGEIIVRTWAKAEVKITGSLGKGVEKLEITGDQNNLSIRVKYPKHGRNGGWFNWKNDESEPTRLEVTVPQRVALDIDGVSADIDVQQVAGRTLVAESVSGDVTISASSPGEARIESVSGDLNVRITTARVQAETVSGDIQLSGGLTGEIELESVSGDITFATQNADSLSASTVSGDVDLSMGLKNNGNIKADSVSGTLGLKIPANTNAAVKIESFSGTINTKIGMVKTEKHGPGSSLKHTMGSGSGEIYLDAFSGDVNLQTY